MLLRKTGIRKAYRIIAGFVPPVTQFLNILQAVCAFCLYIHVYLSYLIGDSLKTATWDFLFIIKTQLRENRIINLQENLLLET